ncbi:Facilitated trehalose transporter Tret1 [Eumeta japonica]|uniref:Facilitated trehalose transporter Tret1 n=1 Tax=Eumeta variegata TaxID=151549 RepID=A0A4C1V0K3_EUMVA|nr:Facilitated trehalose transporter Tret1 [Eumeta japonica]
MGSSSDERHQLKQNLGTQRTASGEIIDLASVCSRVTPFRAVCAVKAACYCSDDSRKWLSQHADSKIFSGSKGLRDEEINSASKVGDMEPCVCESDTRSAGVNVTHLPSAAVPGALVGGVLGGLLMRLGRRLVLLGAALPYSLAWLCTALSTSLYMILATSFCGGLLVCVINMLTQVYITEIAVPEIRGCLSSVLKILSQIGILISFSLGAYLNWQELALVVAAAPILLFAALLCIPETPSLLLLRGREEAAARSLQWLRGPEADIRQELATIRTNILASKQIDGVHSSKFSGLFSKQLTRPVLITCGLMFFQKFTGAHVFNYYAVPIFKKTFRMMNPHGGAILVSVVQLLASCLSGMLIDNVGRLPLLLISGVLMTLALAGFGFYAYYDNMFRSLTDMTHNEPGSYDWIPLACVLTFTIAFALGISPISSLLVGELFPLKYRSTGSALSTSFSHLCGFVNVKTAADFQDHIGLHGLFWCHIVPKWVGSFAAYHTLTEYGREVTAFAVGFVRRSRVTVAHSSIGYRNPQNADNALVTLLLASMSMCPWAAVITYSLVARLLVCPLRNAVKNNID